MKTSHNLRIIANDIETLEETKQDLKAKQIWDKTNEIRERLVKILESDLFSDL